MHVRSVDESEAGDESESVAAVEQRLSKDVGRHARRRFRLRPVYLYPMLLCKVKIGVWSRLIFIVLHMEKNRMCC